METYIAELKYKDITTGTDYYVDTRAIKDADDTTKTLKQTLDGKQSALPSASAAGKVLKSTNTTGGIEWGEVTSPVEIVQTTGTSLTSVMSQNAVTSEIGSISSSINDKVPKERKINGKTLDADVALTPSDVGAATANHIHAITDVTDLQNTLNGKADKKTTLAGYGISDAKINGGTITLGTATIKPITDVSNKANKSTTTVSGTYKSVTVNTDGIVTSGSNPSTLEGYGITDAVIDEDGTITLGSKSIKPLTSVTKAQVGLGSVVNSGDSATPVSGGTTKFTTGGAYTELAKKLDIAQSSENAGKALVVGADGNVAVSALKTINNNSLVGSGNIQCGHTWTTTTPSSGTGGASSTTPAVVVENYANGDSWYRVWSDGWIEQGGVVSNRTTATINFLKSFQQQVLYVVTTSLLESAHYALSVNNITTSSFQAHDAHIDAYYQHLINLMWYACGY